MNAATTADGASTESLLSSACQIYPTNSIELLTHEMCMCRLNDEVYMGDWLRNDRCWYWWSIATAINQSSAAYLHVTKQMLTSF